MICIGAGAGNETNYLIEKGYEVWALDPSSSSMDYIKNRTPENRLDKLHLLQSKLVASFFGDKFTGFDKKDAVNMTWLTEKRVEGMLSKFDIKLFKIRDAPGKSATGVIHHDHVFKVIAQKKHVQ